ncbi:MAG: glucosaminidase domain-containing protein [Flavobacteriaceae bacterium]|nr:glucosaminidase domain-containing protein [Flavobacteriaceae bacterium]
MMDASKYMISFSVFLLLCLVIEAEKFNEKIDTSTIMTTSSQNRLEKDNVEYIQTIRSLNQEATLLKEKLVALEDKPRDMTEKIKYVHNKFPKELINLAPLAENERVKYGIPVSITLAQAYLESGIRHNKPPSELYTVDNNLFGIKWKEKSFYQDKLTKAGLEITSTVWRCNKAKTDCAYYIKFNTRWDCLRAKSIMITGSLYRNLRGKSYPEFARGLKKAGYATDPRYAYKLINIIIDYRLYELD